MNHNLNLNPRKTRKEKPISTWNPRNQYSDKSKVMEEKKMIIKKVMGQVALQMNAIRNRGAAGDI